MDSVSRRSLLCGAGLCTSASLAGCNALGLTEETPNRAKVTHVHVNIVHEQSHTVDLLIMEDETPVYLRSRTFAGAADESDPYEVGGGTFDDIPEQAGEYVIWLQLDGRRWDKFDFSEWDTLPAGWDEGEFPDAIAVGYSIGHEGREEGPPAVSFTVEPAKEGGSGE